MKGDEPMSGQTDTINLPTLSACVIWKCEIVGQLSDGAWENARPYEHWKFWSNMGVKFDASATPHVSTKEGNNYRPYECKKNAYNLTSLYEYVGDRMLAQGRMGRALETMGFKTAPETLADAAEYLANMGDMQTFTQVMSELESLDEHKRNYLTEVTPEIATQFFATTYVMKDLKQDIKLIKTAMKSVVIR